MTLLRSCCLFYAFALLSACGLESSIPVEDPNTGPVVERAVNISGMSAVSGGYLITCELNSAIVTSSTLPLFIEFEGTEVERVNLTNQATHTFSVYNPPTTGNLVCVTEYSGAEFESEAQSISPNP